MSGTPELAVKVSAKTDQFTAAIAAMRKELAGLAGAAEKAGRATGRTRREPVLPDLGRYISRGYQAASEGFGRGLSAATRAAGAVPGLGAIAGAASIAGVGDLVTRLSSMGVELTNTARLAGTSAEGLMSLRGAARIAGLSAADADNAMLGLNHTLEDAVYGRDPQAAAWFHNFGIDIGNAAQGARRAEDVLPAVVTQLTNLARIDPRRAELLANMLHIPSSALPLFIQGTELLEERRREVERIYGSLDEYQRISARATEATGRLSIAGERLGMTITTALEPHLVPLLDHLATWVEHHDRDIGGVFDHIGASIEHVNWSAAGRAIEGVGGAFSYAADHTRLFSAALEGIAATSLIRLVAGNTAVGRLLLLLLAGYEGLNAAGLIADHPSLPGSDGAPVVGPDGVLTPGAERGEHYGHPPGVSEYPTSRRPLPAGPLGGFEGGVSPSSGRQTQSTNSATRAAFLAKWGPQAQRIAAIVGTSPENILAHWAAETDWGRAEHDNNVGNLHALRPGPNTTMRGDRHGDGSRYTAPFFIYDSPEAAADAYASWIVRHGAVGPGTDETPAEYAQRLIAHSYLEDRNAPAAFTRNRRELAGVRANPNASDQGVRPSPALGQPSDQQPLLLGHPANQVDERTDNDGRSTVRIEIEHKNVPQGVVMTPTVIGDGVQIAGVRVRQAMPNAGASPYGGGN